MRVLRASGCSLRVDVVNTRVSSFGSRSSQLAFHLRQALQSAYRHAASGAESARSRSFSIAKCRPAPAPLAAVDVMSGDPRARSVNMIASADGKFDCGVWGCTPGKFRIKYRSDELVHILEGRVTVRVRDTTHTLAAGDVAYFPAGTEAEWDITSYVRKLWVYRTPSPSLVKRLAHKLLRMLPGAGGGTAELG